MLYPIYKFFGINFFSYITVRSAIAFFLAFFITVFIMPKFIKWAKNKNVSQPIYDLSPKTHQVKSNTPTMGGITFIIGAIISIIICGKLSNFYVVGGIICLLGFSILGLDDDISKVVGKSNHAGLSARTKFAFQIILSLIISLFLYKYIHLNSEFYLPFCKYPLFDMSYFSIVFWVFVLTASSNAVNLTDGLDGLATVPSIFSLITLGVFSYLCGHAIYSQYLLLPKIVDIGELCVIISALIGSLLAFLWYNCYPAQVFMGDSGSLSLGAFIGYCAIVTKNEVLLILIGFIFVIETLSVIIQVASYKLFKKRVFLMAPIHHHFELKNWVENKIIIRFWTIALLANLIALISIKLR